MENPPADPAREEMKRIFRRKLKRILKKCNDHSKLLTNKRYNQLLQELKDAKQAKENGKRLTDIQSRRLKRFDIWSFAGTERLMNLDVEEKKGKKIKRFIC